MMERYLYFCPKCNFLGSTEHESPNELQKCSQCKSIMKKYTGMTKEE
jgi:transcription initiation factor IIE alpha subunit